MMTAIQRLQMVVKSRAVPVGHVSTRKGGSRWRKVSSGKWEEVKEGPKEELFNLREEASGLGVKLDAFGGDGQIHLGRIEVPKESRGHGLGERVMGKLLKLADKHGQTLTLTPSGKWGGSVPKLKKWYARLGFVPNKGRHKDYEISDTMYRLPRVKKSRSTHPVILKPADKDAVYARRHEEPGHPYHGSVDVQGIKVHVENRRGSVRRGPGWKTKMGHHYGEIRDSLGADGDPVDAYVGRNHDSPLVVVVHQKEPGTTRYDEDKVMLGFDRVVDALKAYRDQYDRPGFYGTHTAMSVPEFKRLLETKGAKGRKLTKSQREILDLVKAGKPVGHVSTYADGSQWKKTGPGKWEPVGDKKGSHDSPLMKIGHKVRFGDITARVSKVSHGGSEPMITMDSEGYGEGEPTSLSDLKEYMTAHGGKHVGVEEKPPAEKKTEPEEKPPAEKEKKKRSEGVHGTVEGMKDVLGRAHEGKVYWIDLEQLDGESQEAAKHLAIYTNGDLDVFVDPSKFAPTPVWDSEEKDFVLPPGADTASMRANLGKHEKTRIDASFRATRQDYENASKTIAELAGRQPPGDDMPPIIYRGMALPDEVADSLEEGASFDLGPVASFSGEEGVTKKFTGGKRGRGKRDEGQQGIVFVLSDPQVGTHIGGLSHFPEEDEVLSTGKLVVDRTEMKERLGDKLKYVYVTQEKLKKAKGTELDDAHQKIIREAFLKRITDRKRKNR